MTRGVRHFLLRQLLPQAGMSAAIFQLWNSTDEKKAATNLADHDVSFDEAKTVFDDLLHIDFYDSDHPEDEHR